MKRLSVVLLFPLLAGCATLGIGGSTPQTTAEQVALTNLVMSLIGASTGVYLNPGTCIAPPIPDEIITPCAPAPPNATPDVVQAALTACIIDSTVLVAVTKYQRKVCPPPVALPVATVR